MHFPLKLGISKHCNTGPGRTDVPTTVRRSPLLRGGKADAAVRSSSGNVSLYSPFHGLLLF